ncbi:putative transcriptional regulator [uncultured Pleomorphomonas sp.]|uniref:Putative transcriptional regulator n=1 Tax=uncultured Pleomorphomonas sp. TaxID=442121 RepID=A0A212LNL1_9HYPH|nr:IclR family transcriptional regulator [uncultured Pleomorphomonas sp.]SCM79118.1 putative transcriptional regulator [uncultured Pleomorphomonas sp.]
MVTTQTPAIDKAMAVFAFLAENGRASFTQIQKATGLPKSTSSSLLASLLAHGLVSLEEGRYALGLRWYELGNKVEESLDIKRAAMEPLTQLRDRTQLTCHLGVLEGSSAIYVLKLESPTAIVIRSWVGRRLSLHSSGLGKALLAWLPEAKLNAILPDIDFVRRTDTTIVGVEAFREELAATRQRGWAFDNAEDNDGVYCVAAPLINAAGEVTAAISVSGVSSQVNRANLDDIAAAVVATAGRIAADYRH